MSECLKFLIWPLCRRNNRICFVDFVVIQICMRDIIHPPLRNLGLLPCSFNLYNLIFFIHEFHFLVGFVSIDISRVIQDFLLFYCLLKILFYIVVFFQGIKYTMVILLDNLFVNFLVDFLLINFLLWSCLFRHESFDKFQEHLAHSCTAHGSSYKRLKLESGTSLFPCYFLSIRLFAALGSSSNGLNLESGCRLFLFLFPSFSSR
mmetsp:Transcript_32760/g.54899  ORF Transcript_32760/g.54899 Transcript_32760/m.54899 type:complete len:205 (-) Transcript_32760:196-810(-)